MMRCPLCRNAVEEKGALPFCSERCRRLDLGKWLSGDYRFIGERVDPQALYDTAEEPLGATHEDLP